MDVHVEDEAKVTSSISNNIEDVVHLKSKEETSIDLTCQHFDPVNSVGHNGTRYKGKISIYLWGYIVDILICLSVTDE